MKNKLLALIFLLILIFTHCIGQNYAPVTFNWEKSHADRFVNSPCFKILGFDPRRDIQEQERIYNECEEAKRKEEMEKYFKIGLGILLVGGFGAAIVYNFNKGAKK